MASGSKALHPMVFWAQRKEHIFVTIEVEAKDQKLDITASKISFSGEGEKKTRYACELDLFGEVEPDGMKRAHTDRHVQLLIPKKDKEAEWWPRLLKGKGKHPCIKVDFDKWKDEDEAEEGEDFGAMGGMGGMGGANFDLNSMMSQMGGLEDRPDLGDLGDEDSDNEELPDLEDDEPAKTNGNDAAEEPQPSTAAQSDPVPATS